MTPTIPCTSSRMQRALRRVRDARVTETCGRVVQLIGLVVESEGPLAALGEVCRIQSARGQPDMLAEVVGFRNHHLLLMPLGELHGIHPGSEVIATGAPMRVAVGGALKGRVIDGLGNPIDGHGPIVTDHFVGLNLRPPHPLKRQRINQVFQTGIKSVDTFTPLGRGQRLGIFAGSGVGKSTLLGMMASQAEADVNVIALIGERGREVREFMERDLDEPGRKKSVVIVATSNEPALNRVKGAFLAMAIAEHFRDAGQNVLLMMDSVTRFAMAQREIGLAAGEPPTTKGYPPTVFSELPKLLERAGPGEKGSGNITGLFTVLVDGDDHNEPIADAARGILDGHIVLDRSIAERGRFPAVNVLRSISRTMPGCNSDSENVLVNTARRHFAAYENMAEMIRLGAYRKGSNAEVDEAMNFYPALEEFLRQGKEESATFAESYARLGKILGVG